MKKISIITINYNNCEGLRRTLESVAAQTCKDFEYIVIDGGSTDGSVELIKQYESIISYWVSEPDRGIYHAMNKGVAKATGEYCNFLNSGDSYHDGSVINKFVNCKQNADILTGAIQYVFNSKNEKILGEIKRPYEYLYTDHLLSYSIPHPASLIKTELLRENPYDESLKIVSDWKFWLQELIINERTYEPVDFIAVDFDCSGISQHQENLVAKERIMVLESLFPRKLIQDYLSKIKGRTTLEKTIFYSNPNGITMRLLTFICDSMNKLNKFIKK